MPYGGSRLLRNFKKENCCRRLERLGLSLKSHDFSHPAVVLVRIIRARKLKAVDLLKTKHLHQPYCLLYDAASKAINDCF